MNRESLLSKIRALMAKTVDNGCTEEEALSALAKARAMMDAYEISEEELALTKAEKAVLRQEPPGSRDPHGIKSSLATAVAEFCDCRVWRSNKSLVFCGLQSDAQFATWLLDSLTTYAQSALANHLIASILPPRQRRFQINGFVGGCTSRISERLRALIAQSKIQATNNGRALVVIKSTAVADKMKELGIRLGSVRRSSRRVDGGSYAAGKSAGDGASFGHPVSGNGGTLRIGD